MFTRDSPQSVVFLVDVFVKRPSNIPVTASYTGIDKQESNTHQTPIWGAVFEQLTQHIGEFWTNKIFKKPLNIISVC